MKKLLFIATAFIASLTVTAQSADQVIKVTADKHDFGKIKQNAPVTTFFEIKNTSDKPVVIENAWGSCGCTTPEVPKEPISPNTTTKLKVQYNAAAVGTFNKDVYVKLAGIDEPKILKISGEVLDTPAFEAYAKEQGKAKSAKKS